MRRIIPCPAWTPSGGLDDDSAGRRPSSTAWHATRRRAVRDQRRTRFPAALRRIGASRMERAARRRIQRIRHFAGDRGARLAGHLEVRHRVEQHPRVRVAGRREKRPRGGELDDPAEVHDADAIGDVMDDGEIVRDEHVR